MARMMITGRPVLEEVGLGKTGNGAAKDGLGVTMADLVEMVGSLSFAVMNTNNAVAALANGDVERARRNLKESDTDMDAVLKKARAILPGHDG
ncbi:hypothetical protein [Sphingomonas sp. NFR15]|uniref:hypothetical protein n=1 Tax=Sphingomonas sp. NFR15 TaxID=1566282 RepID=UPI0015A4D80E|nr:hypothetical protein [Sphingomonas sp. NFR15]